MNIRHRFLISTAALTLGAFALAGCSSGPSQTEGASQEASAPSTEAPAAEQTDAESSGGEVCEVLTGDTETAATVFAPILPGQTNLDRIKVRIQLLDSVERPPADLSAEWQEWREYLDFAEENFESDPNAVVLEYQEVDDSGDALSDFYTGTCL